MYRESENKVDSQLVSFYNVLFDAISSAINQLILGSKKLSFYEFDVSFDSAVSDDKSILGLVYSSRNCEFYTCSGRNVRVWSF